LKRYSKVLIPVFAFSEMLAIALAALVANYFRHGSFYSFNGYDEIIPIIAILAWPLLGSSTGYYKDRRTLNFLDSFTHLTLQWLGISFILFTYLVMAKVDVSRLSFATFLTLAFILLIISSRVRHHFLIRIRRRGMNRRTLLFVGAMEQRYYLQAWLEKNPSYGYQITRLIDQESGFTGLVQETQDYLHESRVDEVLIGDFEHRGDVLTDLVDIAEEAGCRVRIVQEQDSVYTRQLDIKPFGPFKVFSVREEPLANTAAKIFKRVCDVIFSLLILLTLYWWVHLIIYGLMKLSSRGPVFFKQKRVGRGGSEFYCYKFRTMEVNGSTCEGKGEITKKADSRITPLGKILRQTNLDELPQFINVLLGDMSIIGPRPHMLEEDHKVAEVLKKYRIRRFVRPGISGWAQVNGYRGGTEDMGLMQKRVDYDIEYIESWTPLLDLKIVYLTIIQMLTLKTGAH